MQSIAAIRMLDSPQDTAVQKIADSRCRVFGTIHTPLRDMGAVGVVVAEDT